MYRIMLIEDAAAGLEGLIGCYIVQRKFLYLFWYELDNLFFSHEEAQSYINKRK